MKVLIVGKAAPEQGGIPTLIEQLLRSPLKAWNDLRLLNLSRPTPHPGARLSVINATRTWRDFLTLAQASTGQDVVHLHTAYAPLVTAVRAGLLVLAASRGGRVLVHVHGGLVEHWLRGPLTRALTRTALSHADLVAVVSEGARRSLAPVLGADRVVLVDNGVDETEFVPAVGRRDGPPRVLYAGILSPRKGLLELFTASDVLRRRGIDHELIVAGGNTEQGSDVEHAVRAAAPADVHFLGPVPREEMPALLRDADVFCLPSWLEAMPMSVLEAMAAGVPVVATTVGDLPRVVVDGVTGVLVPPQDPEALTDALAGLLGDPRLREQLGTAGHRRLLGHFTVTRTAVEVQRLYNQILSSPRHRRPWTARSRATPGT